MGEESGEFKLQLELHKQRLEFVENELIKHSSDDNNKFSELKELLVKIHDGAAGERERMFEIFDKKLVELKADFKDHYQTKTEAEKSESKVIKVIAGSLFSICMFALAIFKLYPGE